MKVMYQEGGKVKTILYVKEVSFTRRAGEVEIIPNRGKTKTKPVSLLLEISE